jgi:hypothetical protein
VSKPHYVSAPLTQQAFSFTSDDEAQETAIDFEEQQRRRVAYVLRHTNLPPINIEVLKQPIFTRKGERFLEDIDALQSKQSVFQFVFNKEPTASDKAEDIEAILGNLHKFVAHFVDTVLEGLADVGGVDEKIDTLEWIFAQEKRIETRQPGGYFIRIPKKDFPFSFNWCCSILGLYPDRMRSIILECLNDLLHSVEDRIKEGTLKPMRREAISKAVYFIKERSTNGCY